MINTLLLAIFSIFIYFLIYIYRNKIGEFLSVIDHPNETRKIHTKPTPKTASYSIVIFLIFYLILNLLNNFFDNSFNWVLVGTFLVFLVGFFDDKYKLSPVLKTIAISIITLLLCANSDSLLIDKFYIKSLDFYFQLKIFSYIFTILCVLCLVNSLNLSDGINGLAIGIIFFWLLYINQIYKYGLESIIVIILSNLILMFIHNYKGDHFLGDAGSLMLSGFVAFLIIWLHNKNISHPSQVADAETVLILFILPVIDMLRLLFERLLNKKNPAYGDNHHLHHYLINKFKLNGALLVYFLFFNFSIFLSIYSNINKIYIITSLIIIYSIFIYHYKSQNK